MMTPMTPSLFGGRHPETLIKWACNAPDDAMTPSFYIHHKKEK
jgi:hypothetical protein